MIVVHANPDPFSRHHRYPALRFQRMRIPVGEYAGPMIPALAIDPHYKTPTANDRFVQATENLIVQRRASGKTEIKPFVEANGTWIRLAGDGSMTWIVARPADPDDPAAYSIKVVDRAAYIAGKHHNLETHLPDEGRLSPYLDRIDQLPLNTSIRSQAGLEILWIERKGLGDPDLRNCIAKFEKFVQQIIFHLIMRHARDGDRVSTAILSDPVAIKHLDTVRVGQYDRLSDLLSFQHGIYLNADQISAIREVTQRKPDPVSKSLSDIPQHVLWLGKLRNMVNPGQKTRGVDL